MVGDGTAQPVASGGDNSRDGTVPTRPWVAHYAPGVPADIEIPDESLVDGFEAAVARYGDRSALVFFGARTSYTELGRQVARMAGALRSLGVRAGDRVALVLPNCPQHVVAYYAALRLGAVVVEHNPLYTEQELAAQFADHAATLAIAWDKVAPKVAAAAGPTLRVVRVDLSAALPAAKRLALRLPVRRARTTRAEMTPASGDPRPGMSFETLLRRARPLDSRVPRPTTGDLALIQYTGGTTGAPKGAMLTHRNLLADAVEGRAWVPTLSEGQETVYAVLPLFHVFGLTMCLNFSIRLGATMVLFPRFDVDQMLDAVAAHPPTFLPAVPPVYARLVERAPQRGVDLRSVKVGFSGAMSLGADIIEAWEGATGSYLVEGYGMTESSPITVGNPVSGQRRPGSIGVPFPNTDVRVVDPEDPGVDRPPGEPGELLVRGPQVFRGYWDRPQDTAAALLPGGWLRTGDIVTQDADGFLTVVDRMKELIITGGFNVYPTEVEEVIRRLPGVADVAVVGVPDAHSGEEVVAAVVPGEGAAPDTDAVRAACRSRLAAYKVPRRVVTVDDLPRSQLGKILRRQVREMLTDPERPE